MLSKTFLSMCPACTKAERFPQIDLHSIVTCTKCYARFIAEENYVDIEVDDAYLSEPVVEEETALHIKGSQKEITTKEGDKGASKDDDKHISFGKQQETSVEWMLVSSKGLQEETRPVDAEVKASMKSVRVSFEKREQQKGKSLQAVSLNKVAKEVSLKASEWPNKKKPQSDSRLRKRKYIQSSAAWGIGLRKPCRERRQVKSYSPSRESGLLKRRRLRLQKENRVAKSAGKKYKKKAVQNQQSEWRQNYSSFEQDVPKSNRSPAGKADASSKPSSKIYSEEFTNFIKLEIKRQVLEGLGETSTKMIKEIEVVEVEDILPPSSSIQSDYVADKQEFTLQVKLMTTILFPITLKTSERPVKFPESPKTIENLGEVKCSEETKDELNSVQVSEVKNMREPGPVEGVETEPVAELVNDESLSDYEPLLENGDVVNVPNSEYYDFEFNRSEDRFAPQQIWASYDPGMMPRDYLQIKKVVNIKPFKVLVSVLEPSWLSESGNPLSCGEYSTDNRIRIMKEINGFSHLMRWRSDQNGMIHIYPGEEEVWALYKDWKEPNQEKRIRLGYDLVQVISIKEDLTVNVIPLVNHKGSKTVFRRNDKELFQIHKKDFDRFSHQIPTFEIIGYDGVEGCMELDPAAIPLD